MQCRVERRAKSRKGSGCCSPTPIRSTRRTRSPPACGRRSDAGAGAAVVFSEAGGAQLCRTRADAGDLCRAGHDLSAEGCLRSGSPAAAANGQYLLIRRDAYDAVGGHAAVATDILEDVELAKRAKQAGYKLQFRWSDVVTTRMYRSFPQMWEGWTKNLALLFPHPRRLALLRLMRVCRDHWLAGICCLDGDERRIGNLHRGRVRYVAIDVCLCFLLARFAARILIGCRMCWRFLACRCSRYFC